MPSQFSESGLSGLETTGGYVTEDEFLPGLVGRRAIEVYEDMSDNDPIVGAFMFAIEMLIRQVTWRVEPLSDDEADLEAAEFLTSCMDDMSNTWADTISEVLTMLPYGWAYMEIVYKRRDGKATNDPKSKSKYTDGKVGWRKIALRGQKTLDRWEFDDEGGIQAMIQKPPPDYQDRVIPIEKALLFRTSVKRNNPEGRSILRNAYRPWYFKKRIEEIEGVGIERDLAGLPFATVDPDILRADATADQRAILESIKNIVMNVRRDTQEGIVWPAVFDDQGNRLYSFELLSSGGSRQFDTSAIIERYVRHIAMTVLADFITLGHEAVGSFALADSKTDMFAVALGAWLDVIADVFNRYAVPRLFALNGFDLEDLPEIKHGDLDKPDLSSLAEFIIQLGQAGMPVFPDEKLEAWLRQVAGLPEKSEDAEPVLPNQPKPAEEEDEEVGTPEQDDEESEDDEDLPS